MPSGGSRVTWDVMVRPLRGADDDQRAYREAETEAMKDQEMVRALLVLYR